MTIAANSYAEYLRRLLGSPPIIGANRTIETPSVDQLRVLANVGEWQKRER